MSLFREFESIQEKGLENSRTRKPPRWAEDYASAVDVIPRSYKKADEIPEWKDAMLSELESMATHNVWDTVEAVPQGAKVIGTKWVFTVKRDELGLVVRNKARLVAQGFRQKLDKNEVASPVVKTSSKMITMAIAAFYDLSSEQVDVKTAFLHGVLEEPIYCKPPPQVKAKYLKLKKSLYGLRQSPKLWYECVMKVFSKMDFKSTLSDPCLLYKGSGQNIQLVNVHVDDFSLYASNQELVDTIEVLKTSFDIKLLGPVHEYLGINIERIRNEKKVLISQCSKIDELLKQYKMEECNPCYTPLDPNHDFIVTANEKQPDVPYREAIGKLLYLSSNSRPDIATAVSILSRYSTNFTNTHWKAVKRIFRYLKGTRDLKMVIQPKDLVLHGYCDADWAGDKNSRRSRTGYCFYLGGALISWKSKLQPTVAALSLIHI